MKKKRYLKFLKDCMKRDRLMPHSGLCASLGWPDDLYLFMPDGAHQWHFWAGDDHLNLNELRETIVLFLAAMNDEL